MRTARPTPSTAGRRRAAADAGEAAGAARSHWIDDWRPEDPEFWETTGKWIARRNLIFSILSEHIGFAVWSLWSVFVLFLGDDYGFTPAQKFLLTTVPTAVGAFLRLPYTCGRWPSSVDGTGRSSRPPSSSSPACWPAWSSSRASSSTPC